MTATMTTPEAISTHAFFWNAESGMFLGDADDFHADQFCESEEAFFVRSERTGAVVKYTYEDSLMICGELVYTDYKPDADSQRRVPGCRGTRVRLCYNADSDF